MENGKPKTGNVKPTELTSFLFPVSCFRFSIFFSVWLKAFPVRD
jgi:hypothetical protein